MQFSFILNLQKNNNNLNKYTINTDAVSIASDMLPTLKSTIILNISCVTNYFIGLKHSYTIIQKFIIAENRNSV